jgi:hypothetical protein
MEELLFTESTKTICTCTFISILLIILFIISPLSNFFKTSFLMKVLTIAILVYTFYLNTKQTDNLKSIQNLSRLPEILNQLNINIISSYIFTVFIGLLIIFVIKSFF